MKNLENKNLEVKDLKNNKINLKEAIVGFHNIFMDAQKQKLEFDEYADKLSEKVEEITSDFY